MKFSFEKESIHEEKLRRYFDEFELPDTIKPLNRPVCIVLFTNRSGSSVVGEHMRATDRFTGFGEPLNYKLAVQISKREQLRSFLDYLQWQVSRLVKPDAIIGMKASYGQAMMLLRSGAIPHYFNDVRWVMLQRSDVLAQAISFSIAAQTKQWTSGKDMQQSEVRYDFVDIKKRVKALSESYSAMNTFCAVFGIEPYRIVYEDFVADPKLGAGRLASHLGVDEVSFDDSRLKMRKQRNHLNQQFKENFLSDYRKQLSSRK